MSGGKIKKKVIKTKRAEGGLDRGREGKGEWGES